MYNFYFNIRRCGQIHVDPIPVEVLWKNYVEDMKEMNYSHLSETTFRKQWKTVFSHVRARIFKQVNLKCSICADLTEQRQQTRDHELRKELTLLAGFHRMTFMGERRIYYDKRLQAQRYPDEYFSTIGDGMAQSHCSLPYRANLSPCADTMDCHMQGIINHGRNSFTIYRSFANVIHGTNMAIHSWLCELDKEFRLKGRLPDCLYHQIDGGPENANNEHIWLAELLIQRGLTRKIVLSRLIKGHTHEVCHFVYVINIVFFKNKIY